MSGELDVLRRKVDTLPDTPAGNFLRQEYLRQIAEAKIKLQDNPAINPPVSAAKAKVGMNTPDSEGGVVHSSSHGPYGKSTDFNSDGVSSKIGG